MSKIVRDQLYPKLPVWVSTPELKLRKPGAGLLRILLKRRCVDPYKSLCC